MNIGYFVVTLVVSISGIVGNALVVGAILVHKRLRVLNNTFIVNLAVADFFVAGIIHPFTAIGITRGKDYFYHEDATQITGLCEFLASFCVISCTTSVFSIATVALNRYIYICHHHSYPKIYTRRTVPFMVVGMWMYGCLVDFPLFVGFGRHEFHTRASTCIFDTIHSGYKIYFVVIGILIPIGIISYCYTRIVWFVAKTSRRLQNRVESAGSSSNSTNPVRPADVKLLKTVAAIGTLGVIIYTPLALTLLLDHGQVPKRVWMFSTGLMHSYSCINWCVYALTNSNFRAGYVMLLRKLLCGHGFKQPLENSRTTEMTNPSVRIQSQA
ncbi:melatonin receptor type 1B-B-like [Amphiura filiformis]|uniref:melatonin receptor type 1B-B-like n=1 Tax=Amphiura filiformis TaxID=82378 RepID=UPI003B221535